MNIKPRAVVPRLLQPIHASQTRFAQIRMAGRIPVIGVRASKDLSMSDREFMIDDENKNAGTPENGSLIVKLLQDEWIVEDAQGECLGSGKDRERVIGIAREAQKAGRGTSISVEGEDGAHEKTLN